MRAEPYPPFLFKAPSDKRGIHTETNDGLRSPGPFVTLYPKPETLNPISYSVVSKLKKPKQFFLLIALVLLALLCLGFWYFEIHLLIAYLVSINLITFFFFGYDKRQAAHRKSRVPEIILHGLTLIGGTAGSLLGQLTFRHKTRKRAFQFTFLLIIILQAVALFSYWKIFAK
jgi:uncharacterized membrane protein YsdA (DUF1294 family)